MSAGKQFLRSVIDQNEPKIFRKIKSEFFLENEVVAYEAVRAHLDSYGAIPSLEVLRGEGIAIPPLRGTPADTNFYADKLRKRYAYNNLNERFPQLTECLKNNDIEGMLQTLRDMIGSAASAIESDSYTTLSEELREVFEEYNYAKQNPGLQGISFGWDSLDQASGGAQGGDLVVVAGRPSMGKSWMLLKMAYEAWRSGHSVAFTSMEMSKKQIARRWIGIDMKVNPNYIRDGELSTYAEERLEETIEELSSNDNAVHLLAGDMSKEVSGVENMIMEFDPDIVYVDSAYLLSPSGKKKGYISKWESISEVVGELKKLAIKYDKPVVISVQFNRNVKKGTNKDMDLGDIAGSDSIPQDASIVCGIGSGVAPFQDSQRVIDMLKNREGLVKIFATAFTFNPVNFDEVPYIPEGSTEEQEVEYDAGWMS